MLVRDVMTTDVVTVRGQARVKEAITLLDRHRITALPVLDDAGTLVGIVSEADLIRERVIGDPRAHEIPAPVPRSPSGNRVADVMSTHPLTVTSTTELAAAAELMTSSVAKSLPVVDYGMVVGMVSRRDIIGVLAHEDARIEAELDGLVGVAGYDWLVDVADGLVTLDGPDGGAQRRLAETLASAVPGVVGVNVHGPRRASRSE